MKYSKSALQENRLAEEEARKMLAESADLVRNKIASLQIPSNLSLASTQIPKSLMVNRSPAIDEEKQSPEFYKNQLQRQLKDYLSHMKEVSGLTRNLDVNRSPAVVENLESPDVYEKELNDTLINQAKEDVERRKKLYGI